MEFNWIFNTEIGSTEKQRCIDMEYKLRPRITRYLIARMEQECDGDFSKFCFDVNMRTKKVTLSEKTPKEYRTKLKSDFELEINKDI